MCFSRKRSPEEYPTEMTAIWSCVKEGCNGWMRQSYSFENVPICAQCKSHMVNSMKELPILYDSGLDRKAALKSMKIKSMDSE